MNISDKTISKWERGLGCPDVSLLPELATIFGVSVDHLLAGELKINEQIGGNMRNLKFYECPQCGNLMTATAEASLSCCGKTLQSLVPKKVEAGHELNIEEIDGELYVTSNHEMTKEHYISFIAYSRYNKFEIIKLYAEGENEVRIPDLNNITLYIYCNKDGLMKQKI